MHELLKQYVDAYDTNDMSKMAELGQAIVGVSLTIESVNLDELQFLSPDMRKSMVVAFVGHLARKVAQNHGLDI